MARKRVGVLSERERADILKELGMTESLTMMIERVVLLAAARRLTKHAAKVGNAAWYTAACVLREWAKEIPR